MRTLWLLSIVGPLADHFRVKGQVQGRGASRLPPTSTQRLPGMAKKRWRRRLQLVVPLLACLFLLFVEPYPASAASDLTIIATEAVVRFRVGILFTAHIGGAATAAELRLHYPGSTGTDVRQATLAKAGDES